MDLKASWIKFGTGVFKKRDKTLSMSRIQFKECLERSGAPQFHSEIFQALDGDGDSELCFEELLSLFLPMHTRRELHNILETIERDEEKNGVVDAAFTPPKNRPYTKAPERHASAQHLTADKQDEIRAIFRIWDTDESGSIDLLELQTAMQEVGFLEMQIKSIFDECDVDGNGELEEEEFLETMAACYI